MCIRDSNPYMRSPWNWLDFICVVTSYSFLMPGAGGNVSGLRAFRALRPLRTINRVPGMKVLVRSLLHDQNLVDGAIIDAADGQGLRAGLRSFGEGGPVASGAPRRSAVGYWTAPYF